MSYRLGVDVGGTFTDLVLFDEAANRVYLAKVPSTVRNQSLGVVEGMRKIAGEHGLTPAQIGFLIHGTTVATNALLERKGVPCALITTRGCRDLLQIGRQDRPSLYNSFARRPAVIVPRRLRFEVSERVLHSGEVETPLDEAEVVEVIERIKAAGVGAIGVCLLHSYANPAHERRIGELIEQHYPGATISLSHEILSEFKEYERLSTTLVNVYVMPIVKRYLDDLEAGIAAMGVRSPLHIMQSNGGVMSAGTAARRSVHTVLSGPAGGVVGALLIADQVGAPNIISIDMGGTSLDVALCHAGEVRLTMQGEVADLPVKVPMLDIHTLGAGGGSIAWIDPGGALRVGPQSAGADPGPACYGRGGTLPTVTDANLVLGRLNPDYFVGGEMRLDVERARQAIRRVIAEPLGLTVEQAAAGMIDVINATMVKGMRYVSVQRGYDPREFSVVAFGGAGPLHAAALAAELGAPRVISPPMPGVTSALGLLVADFRHDYSQTYLHTLDFRSLLDFGSLARSLTDLNAIYANLEQAAREQMGAEGVPAGAVVFLRNADVRYLGQGYELQVPVPAGALTVESLREVAQQFFAAHRRQYGYVKDENDALQLVNLRLTAIGRVPRPQFAAAERSALAGCNPARALKGRRAVYFDGKFVETPIYERSALVVGDAVVGPAVVEQLDSTTVLSAGQRGEMDGYGNLVIDVQTSDLQTSEVLKISEVSEVGAQTSEVLETSEVSEEVSAVDPITLEVMRNALYSIADEMTAALVRTGYSTNIKDRRDCSCAIYDVEGNGVAQSELNTPVHLGTMHPTVRTVLDKFPAATMQPGDAFVLNTPYPAGPGHLNDVAVVSPVFCGGRLVALVANQAHHVDMGGFAPGSMPFGVTEIYQEGLQIPPLQLRRAGVMDEGLLELILENVRTRFEVRGDLMAQIAANNVGQMRLEQLIEKHGFASVQTYLAAMMDYSERRLRAGLRRLPAGRYTYEDYLEGDGVSDALIKIKVTAIVEGDEITFDFEGTDAQVAGPLNCRWPSVAACVFFVIKALIDPELPPNAGAYRPVHIRIPEGSLLSATYPAAVCNANILTAQRLVDVLWGAFLQAIPERVTAASSGTMNLLNIGGLDGRGRYYNYVETYAGGQGAAQHMDGMDAVQNGMTNTRNAPIEAVEAAYPLMVEEYALVPNSEGAGRQRGGVGMTRCFRILGRRAKVTLSTDRMRIGPWGVAGGLPASGARCTITKANGEVVSLGSKVTTFVEQGDRIRAITPGGGGWGAPQERDAEAVKRDVAEGLVSPERAREVYGAEGILRNLVARLGQAAEQQGILEEEDLQPAIEAAQQEVYDEQYGR